MSGNALLDYAYLIPLAPLAACALILAFRKILGLEGAWVGVLALGYCFVHASLIAAGIFSHSIALPMEGMQGHFYEFSVPWFSSGSFDFTLGVLIDGLSSMMLVVVTLVSLLVQIYSISYMHDHPRFGRYFAYVNLFTFSMLILVVGNNLLQIFMGWELVGLCSYLLIGFDFEREAAAYAGRKAFLTTKTADLGMYIALYTTFNYLGTFHLPSLQQSITSVPHPTWVLTLIPLCLFAGCMGKSAQVPFHVWLPDAMEGPTPASALIHAATMVAAGVYLVARVYFLFEAAPISLEVVAWVGVITALVAATMGLVSADIKRVLAFSTVSQLGFMMAALGCGGYAAGMFHLTTHAAFKALLFLCSGSVIHAVHTNDMWKMGGLAKKMPITALAYLIGTLSIAGFPFSSGFYSKEEVLSAALHHNPIIFVLLAFAAFLTSFYMFRTWYLTFVGVPRDVEKHHHAHESPLLMTVPLVVLAIPSVFLGFTLWYHGNLEEFIHWGEKVTEVASSAHLIVMASSLAAFLLGFLGATWVYFIPPVKYEMLAAKLAAPYRILSERYRFDELYLWVIDHAYYPLAHALANIDYDFLDQYIVDGIGRVGKFFSWLSGLFDFNVVDQVGVDGPGEFLQLAGRGIRRLQSGLAQNYLFWMVIGVGSLLVWITQHFK